MSNEKRQKIIQDIRALCSAKLAEDINVIDVSQKSSITDYLIIATCKNERQQKSIINDILKHLTTYKLKPLHQEVTKESGWSVLDFGFIIIHLFNAEQRASYKLDELWSE